MQCFVYFIALVFLILLSPFQSLYAQINKQLRCGTMQDLEYRLQHDPLYLRTMQDNNKRIKESSGMGPLEINASMQFASH
jgi:hypothetical protein